MRRRGGGFLDLVDVDGLRTQNPIGPMAGRAAWLLRTLSPHFIETEAQERVLRRCSITFRSSRDMYHSCIGWNFAVLPWS